MDVVNTSKLFTRKETLTPEEKESIYRVAAFVTITVIALITAILSSFMITEKGTKEHNWWVALMIISWVGFAGTAAAAVLSGHACYNAITVLPVYQ